jgi:transposase
MAKQTNQEKVLAALLETPSIREAAQKTGIGEATIYRYLQDKEFLGEYRAAKRSLVEGSITQLQQATVDAVETLKRNLRSESPSAEIRAAQIILDFAVKGVELTDILERLEVLEDEHQKQIEAAAQPGNRKRF